MRCPGCGQAAPPNTFPAISTEPEPGDPWWCPSCLAATLLAAHTDDCRCAGCRPARRSAA